MGRSAKPTEYEENPQAPIPEPENQVLADEATGERFGRQKRFQAEWKSMKRLRIQGSAVPLRRSEPRSGPEPGRNLETCQSGQTPAAT